MKQFKHIKLHAVAVAAVMILGAPHAMAQFGSLLSKVVAPAGNATDPDAFIKTALTAEKLMNNSVVLLAQSLASKEKAAEFDASLKASSTITDSKEKQAKLNEIQQSQIATINQALSNQQFKEDIKKMDSKQKENLGNAAFNFALALLQDRALVEQSGSLISSVSTNPMHLAKIGSLKDVVGSVSNQVTAASAIAGKMPEIFSAVGVKAPASKDEKPKAMAETYAE
jgi:hypothetical protein